MSRDTLNVRQHLLAGQVIPAHPLALTPHRTVDERHQRALTRYYVAAGAGGMAVGVHTTGFPIHDVNVGLYRPVLELAAETATAALIGANARPFVRVAGLVGDTHQAVKEAEIARVLGYHCGLLSLGAWRDASDDAILRHCQHVAEAIPLFGFYLQPAVGGRRLSYAFWREFAEIANVVAIKVAPFDRYATLDVVRALGDSGREDIALYTGNDDAIVPDLVTDVPVVTGGRAHARHFVGGLLGQWAVWTHRAVQLLDEVRAWRLSGAADGAARMAEPGSSADHGERGDLRCGQWIRGVFAGDTRGVAGAGVGAGDVDAGRARAVGGGAGGGDRAGGAAVPGADG